jgi:hypothetical protein
MYVSASPYGAMTIVNPNQTVAYSQVGLQFAARTCSDDAVAVTTFQQCISQSSGRVTFNAKFVEGFALAFKEKGVNTQKEVGYSYNTETGLVWQNPTVAIGGTTWAAQTTGMANSGTKLKVSFTNVPDGVSIYVTTTQTVAGTSVVSATNTNPAITATLADPSSGSEVTGVTCGGSGTQYTTRKISVSNKAGSATWEIATVADDASTAQKSISFGVTVAYTAQTSLGLPGLTGDKPGAITGSFAPISVVNYATTGDAIPRFVERTTDNAPVFAIVPCVTNLLYPFVSNSSGFDTGIVISNTSLDAGTTAIPLLATSTQTGPCTVFYFNGESTAPAPQTTPTIKPGQVYGFTLSSGGVPGASSSTIGFQGYAIARCNFQFAHGYAYITDRNVPSTGSAGYLALVIPDLNQSYRNPAPFNDQSQRTGEQLAN